MNDTKNIKLIIEYDGTNYAGWQVQNNATSIQQVIESALFKLTGEDINIIGSGRTDSGVHARGQVANFHTESSIPGERFAYALNAILPYDIRVQSSQQVPLQFHARYSAIAKRYRYTIIMQPHGTALYRNYCYHVRQPLDILSMIKAAENFEGNYDFKTFQASGSSVGNTVRTIYRSLIIYEPPYIYFDIIGDGFLYNMVRIMVGTLVEVGRGKIMPEYIKNIILSCDRSKAGPTAPPQGLCLEEVFYDANQLHKCLNGNRNL